MIRVLLLIVLATSSARAADRSELEKIADDIEILHTGVVLYHREDDWSRQKNVMARLWEWEKSAEPEEIWELTKDVDPKIRTLALIAAFDLRDPENIPRFVPFLKDDAESFPADQNRFSSIGHGPNFKGYKPKIEPQTVATFASAMLGSYLAAAGIWTEPDEVTFGKYWSLRKDRDYCLSWYAADLEWASRGISPSPPEVESEVQKLRKRIEKEVSDPVVRAWVLLALSSGENLFRGSEWLASEEDRIRALELLGRDRVMDLFEGKLEWDDPDVHLSKYQPMPFHYGAVVRYALRNSTVVLEEEDFPKLLEWKTEHDRRDEENIYPRFPSVFWLIAAADLKPAVAGALLRQALENLPYDPDSSDIQDERNYLAQALWTHEGEKAKAEIVDWFFAEHPSPSAFGFGRHRFCKWMGRKKTLDLVRAIIRDDRLGELDFFTLRYLLMAGNEASGEELVSPKEIFQAEMDFGRTMRPRDPPSPDSLPADWKNRKKSTLENWVGRFSE